MNWTLKILLYNNLTKFDFLNKFSFMKYKNFLIFLNKYKAYSLSR